MPEDLQQLEDGEEKLPYGEWFYWLQTMVSAIVCIVMVFTFLGRVTRVVGPSMNPTLADGELLLVWSFLYEPKAGDIVILNETTNEYVRLMKGEAIVKRVIATAGQTVDIDYDTGTVYIDGQAIEEPYILEEMDWPADMNMWETHFEIPEDCVFVMGDNRNNSTDSRKPAVGAVHEGFIIGSAKAVLFPLNKIGLLS